MSTSSKKSAKHPAKTQSAKKQSSKNSNGNSASTKNILVWDDDPLTDTTPATRPAPKLNGIPLAIKINGTAPPPRVYPLATKEFRYWAAADALRRGADYWSKILPAKTRWFTGKTLPVTLDDGDDLNAFYDRAGLSFFHATAGGQTIFSGESPDVVLHELGHAVLDALRPQLWDVAGIEAAAFHESFGDMSAILCALQLSSVRKEVLTTTDGKIGRASRLSRVAEQLGWAIRQSFPHAVDSDCLRNAVNGFFYRDPDTLPPSAPAHLLSSESHSFSRIFTGGFFEALGGMLSAQSKQPTERDLERVSVDMGRLLVEAIQEAPIVPDYYSQVAGHMVEADETLFKSKYRAALKSAFVRRGILSISSAAELTAEAPLTSRRGIASLAPVEVEASGKSRVPQIPLRAAQYGINADRIIVRAPGQTKRIAVRSAALAMGSLTTRSEEDVAQSFVEDLFRRGRVDIGSHEARDAGLSHPTTRKTHALRQEADGLTLVRRTFDCGFDGC